MSVEVGVRELRNNLSRLLRQVQEGEEIVVTDRGQAIAHVVPISAPRTFDRLVAEGAITPARRRRGRLPDLISPAGSASDLVAEQRR